MSVSLLQVGDHLSLEFEPSDHDDVKAYIRQRFGDVSSRAAGLVDIVRFGGEQFIFQNEWDDPCLIAKSDRGADLLRVIYGHFAGRDSPRVDIGDGVKRRSSNHGTKSVRSDG